MSEHPRDSEQDEPVGGLSPAPVTPTEDKAEPEAGTGSADKRSPESLVEQEEPASDSADEPGESGGNIAR